MYVNNPDYNPLSGAASSDIMNDDMMILKQDHMMQRDQHSEIKNEEDWGFLVGPSSPKPPKRPKPPEPPKPPKPRTYVVRGIDINIKHGVEPPPLSVLNKKTVLERSKNAARDRAFVHAYLKNDLRLQEQFRKSTVGMALVSGESISEIRDAYKERPSELQKIFKRSNRARLGFVFNAVVGGLSVGMGLPLIAAIPLMGVVVSCLEERNANRVLRKDLAYYREHVKTLPAPAKKSLEKPEKSKNADIRMT